VIAILISACFASACDRRFAIFDRRSWVRRGFKYLCVAIMNVPVATYGEKVAYSRTSLIFDLLSIQSKSRQACILDFGPMPGAPGRSGGATQHRWTAEVF
jgi:hypothetical protein